MNTLLMCIYLEENNSSYIQKQLQFNNLQSSTGRVTYLFYSYAWPDIAKFNSERFFYILKEFSCDTLQS
jgi:hypothetical protein